MVNKRRRSLKIVLTPKQNTSIHPVIITPFSDKEHPWRRWKRVPDYDIFLLFVTHTKTVAQTE